MARILIIGAGNIGRAFIGQVFSKNSWDVVFADISRELVEKINLRRAYPVIIKERDRKEEVITVAPVSAVMTGNGEKIRKEIINADILATSVGKKAIPEIAPLIAEGLIGRSESGREPVDLILAENIHEGRTFLQTELRKFLLDDFDLNRSLGIIQTSIGKMVPIVTDKDREMDPLAVSAEKYNELILDASAFLNPIPDFPEINAVSNIEAYADRKMYIHLLGHAAAAYLGYFSYPDEKYISDVLKYDEIREQVRAAMAESAEALVRKYQGTLDLESLHNHIDDLLNRFANTSLKDTVYRVGRDLERKLQREDRILGAVRMCESVHLPWENIGRVFSAALKFNPPESAEDSIPSDTAFQNRWKSNTEGLINICGLLPGDPLDQTIIKKLSGYLEQGCD